MMMVMMMVMALMAPTLRRQQHRIAAVAEQTDERNEAPNDELMSIAGRNEVL